MLASPVRADLDLLVASRANSRLLHYDGVTGAYEGVFVAAGTGGLSEPRPLELGPDGKLNVGG